MNNKLISMPVVALRGMTVVPEMVIHFDVSRSRSIEAIQRAMQSEEQKVFLVGQRELSIEEPTQKDVYEIGTIATIKQIAKMSKDMYRVLVTGQERARLVQITEENPYLQAEVETVEDYNDYEPEHLKEMPEAKALQEIFFEYSLKSGKIPKEVAAQIADIKEFKGAIFDLDGTLLDSMHIWHDVDEEFFRRRNLKVTKEYVDIIKNMLAAFSDCVAFSHVFFGIDNGVCTVAEKEFFLNIPVSLADNSFCSAFLEKTCYFEAVLEVFANAYKAGVK